MSSLIKKKVEELVMKEKYWNFGAGTDNQRKIYCDNVDTIYRKNMFTSDRNGPQGYFSLSGKLQINPAFYILVT